MKINHIFTILAVTLMLSVSMSGYAQVQKDSLVGWWLFDDETEETGNWGDIILRDAEIKDGQLVCEHSKWANSVKYSGPDITEITLVSWVILDDLGHTHGSALTLDRTDTDQFVAIVYAERKAGQWMPGSSHFRRTDDFPNAVNENKTGELVMLAITYKDIGNKYEITGYRNDKNLGSFNCRVDTCAVMELRTWTKANAEAIWGSRHSGNTTGIVGTSITARIEESRIYNVALTEADVQKMYNDDLPVEARGKLATRWSKIKMR